MRLLDPISSLVMRYLIIINLKHGPSPQVIALADKRGVMTAES